MDGERQVLQDRIEAVAFGGRSRAMRRKGLDVATMKIKKAAEMAPCTASTSRANRAAGSAEQPTAAPKSARISTHSSIEPSWLPQTPEIL